MIVVVVVVLVEDFVVVEVVGLTVVVLVVVVDIVVEVVGGSEEIINSVVRCTAIVVDSVYEIAMLCDSLVIVAMLDESEASVELCRVTLSDTTVLVIEENPVIAVVVLFIFLILDSFLVDVSVKCLFTLFLLIFDFFLFFTCKIKQI